MSTKKLPKATGKNKANQDTKKTPRSTKTINSFFRPISSNRTQQCHSSRIDAEQVVVSDEDLPCVVQHNELNDVISPSPQKANFGEDSAFHKEYVTSTSISKQSHIIIEKSRKYPRLKLKKRNIHTILSEDTCIPISCDHNDGLTEWKPTKKFKKCITYPGEKVKNQDEDVISLSDDDDDTTKSLCVAPETPHSPIILEYDGSEQQCSTVTDQTFTDEELKHKEISQSKKLKLTKRRPLLKNLSSNNNQCTVPILKPIKTIIPTSLLEDFSVDMNANMYMDNSIELTKNLDEVKENIVDLSDINFDETFGGEFDSSIIIPTDTNDNKPICSDIELSDSFIDGDLDAITNCTEGDISVLCTWKVTEVIKQSYSEGKAMEKVLMLKSDDDFIDAICCLRDDWYFMEINIEDKVYVSGLSTSRKSCILDNMSTHYIVTYPNTLISGTSIASSITCERKAVLNERFKMDLQTNKAVFLGSVTHDLFDWVLQHKDCTVDDIEMRARDNLKKPKYLEQLNILNLDIDGLINMQREYYSSLLNWSKQFMRGNDTKIDFKIGQEKEDDFMTSINVDNVIDIEENIWSPCYGLKGKIDATVEITIHRIPKLKNIVPKKRKYKLPLEFKTGKLLSDLGSIDHRAQVAVYTMLMSEKYKVPIESGLLLYGKTGHMIGVPRPEQEKRAILIKRNEVARNLSLERKELSLPPLIQNKRTCRRCDQNETCMLYFKSFENGDILSSGIDELFTELTSHLSSGDLEYFAKWYELIMLEARHENKGSSDKYIWKKSAEEREKGGICFSGMLNVSYEQTDDLKWVYRFKRKENHFNKGCTLKTVPLRVGDRIIISEENVNVFNITTGYITDVSFDVLTVSVHHEVRSVLKGGCVTYRIDKDDTLSNYSTSLKNLSQMFKYNSVIDDKLRNLIIRNDKPQFSDEINVSMGMLDNIGALNETQKEAVSKCLTANDYVIIHGMPGAGKSTTIASIVQALVSNGKSVLLSSYTHSAVDTILIKLIRLGFTNFVRIGQFSRIHPKVLPYSYHEKTKSFTDVHHYKTFYNEQTVVATTCLGVNHPIFLTKQFDYCIVDEASQITQPVCIGPIRKANVFILVGDHNQLPPLVVSHEARDKGFDCSLLQYLSDHQHDAVVTLNYQYRMNSSIMFVMNNLVYGNQMKCANEEVAASLLQLPKYTELCKQGNSTQIWDIVNPLNPVQFVNTDSAGMKEEKNGSFVVNRGEAVLVKKIVKSLIQCGLPCQDIGVISMYRHQVNIIRDEIMEYGSTIEVDTMDKYQGRDKDCIIVSFVRSNTTFEVGELLKDWRRINVAMTRAKTKLIIIGSRTTIVSSEILSKLVDLVESKGWCIDLKEST